MAGRRPKPSNLKNPKDSHRPVSCGPDLPVEIPECPKFLKGEARKEWDEVTLALQKRGTITTADREALTHHCMLWAEIVEASEHIKAEGMVIFSPKGYPVQNPYVGIRHTAQREDRAFLIEYGLTAASRSRVHADGKKAKKANPFSDLADATSDKETTVN
jgi:P27 family predicted phage terminase small subunit